MPRGGDQGGRRPKIWKDSASARSMWIPIALHPQVKEIAMAIDKGDYDEVIRMMEEAKRNQSKNDTIDKYPNRELI